MPTDTSTVVNTTASTSAVVTATPTLPEFVDFLVALHASDGLDSELLPEWAVPNIAGASTWADVLPADHHGDEHAVVLRKLYEALTLNVGQTQPVLAFVRNANLTLSDVLYPASVQVRNTGMMWGCRQGHYWMNRIGVTHKNGQCPRCAGESLTESTLADCKNTTTLYDPARNGNVPADQVPASASLVVTWSCQDNGHVWTGIISWKTKRDSGSCPGCRKGLPTSGWNLAVTYPHIAAMLDPGTYSTIDASTITMNSRTQVTLQCPVASDHVWTTTLRAAIRGTGTKCACCQGQALVPSTSCAALPPELYAALSNPRNGGVDLATIRQHDSVVQLWWSCPQGEDHVWQQSPNEIMDNSVRRLTPGTLPCPFCAGKRVAASNSLKVNFPEFERQWATDLNDGKSVHAVSVSSRKLAWWRCKNGHTWQDTPLNRTQTNAGCHVCGSQRFTLTRVRALLRDGLTPAQAAGIVAAQEGPRVHSRGMHLLERYSTGLLDDVELTSFLAGDDSVAGPPNRASHY